MDEHESAQECLDNLAAYIQLLEAENQRFAEQLAESRDENKQLRLDAHTKDAFYGGRVEDLEDENHRLRDAASEFPVHRPEPLLERPKKAQIYWVPDVSNLDWAFCYGWTKSPLDELRFNRGLCYATEEEAVAASKVMVGEVSDA